MEVLIYPRLKILELKIPDKLVVDELADVEITLRNNGNDGIGVAQLQLLKDGEVIAASDVLKFPVVKKKDIVLKIKLHVQKIPTGIYTLRVIVGHVGHV